MWTGWWRGGGTHHTTTATGVVVGVASATAPPPLYSGGCHPPSHTGAIQGWRLGLAGVGGGGGTMVTMALLPHLQSWTEW